jgi:hypothetical protein
MLPLLNKATNAFFAVILGFQELVIRKNVLIVKEEIGIRNEKNDSSQDFFKRERKASRL